MGNSNISNNYNLDSNNLDKFNHNIKKKITISYNSKQDFIDLIYSEKSLLSNNNIYEKYEVDLNPSNEFVYENHGFKNKNKHQDTEEYEILFKESDLNK